MYLADTSIWIDHLRRGNALLMERLEQDRLYVHMLVVGELCVGNLPRRAEIMQTLGEIVEAPRLPDEEVIRFIEDRRLHGRGIDFIDAHLLASAEWLGVSLWTLDARLGRIALELGVSDETA